LESGRPLVAPAVEVVQPDEDIGFAIGGLRDICRGGRCDV